MAALKNDFISYIIKITSVTRLLSVVVILAELFIASPLSGQSLPNSSNGFSIGMYGGTGFTTLGPGITAGITASNGGHQFILRGVSTDMKPATETWEIAGLYGRVITVRNFQMSAGAGVGIVGGRGYTQFIAAGRQEDLDTMIGFPLDGRIIWTPVRHAGLGLHSFANINTVQPFAGVALTLHLSI